ncbi:hypothetical protein HPP92_007612 [Vanilla planifolia]|uniref:HIT domain-containing protein n=1 Tax=Vanilla planifolia TaxID=51239 RepID=A0A835VA87_VANPL|nr:hypothetical protein HPP92_007612 [Vanilla planifolia]
MERLRLAVICSHLKPVDRRPTVESAVPWELSPSACHGGVGRPEEAAIKEGCVFCLIVRGDSPAYKLYEDDVCLCILDSNPLCSGHSLLIPKFHFPSLQDTPPTVIAALCSIVPFLTGAIVTATQSDSFNLLVNNGTAAGQVIFHTHFHIIPRRAGDQLWPSEGFRRQPIKRDQETFTLVRRIRERISSQPTGNCCTQESQIHKNLLD